MADSHNTLMPSSAKEAKERGEKFYFTGVPCKRGHVACRVAKKAACVECLKFYYRKYRGQNPEQWRQREREYRNRNIEKFKAQDRAAYARNPEKYRANRREWYAKNKEKARKTFLRYMEKNRDVVLAKARIQSAKYRAENPEKARQAIDDWWSRNPGRKKVYHRNRKARKRGNGGSHTAEDIAAIFKAQHGRCAICRKKLGDERHVDHITPIIKGGSNDPKNLQMLCEPCNLAKAARDPIDHMQSLGFLL
jgi:5-methylcytosine-specific restriction endonuclease McrA